MQNKALSKKIGKVEVLELNGPFKGEWAARCEDHIKKRVDHEKDDYSIMFDATAVDEFDDVAARVLIESSRTAHKCAVITRNASTANILLKHDTDHKIFIFEDEEKAVFYLGRELAEDFSGNRESRTFPRLKVAIPCRGYFGEGDSRSSSSVLIVTNLSLVGIFAEFMDSTSENKLKEHLEKKPAELLRFDLSLSPDQILRVIGKIAHVDPQRKGFGLEFVSMEEEAKTSLKEFLKKEKRLLNSANS